MTPRCAMVLAAGLGTRMRPLTDHTAKPLLLLAGRALLDHALDRLAEAGIARVVVNAHWHADRVAAHVADRPDIVVLREDTLLDSGGAVAAALPLLGDAPFYVVNGDSVWRDGAAPALARLADAWTGEADAVLLVHRTRGRGDFAVDVRGVRRPQPGEIVPYTYAGVQLVCPALFAAAPAGAFSFNRLWDTAMAAGRLRAIVHDGLWLHLSTPADLADAESLLASAAR